MKTYVYKEFFSSYALLDWLQENQPTTYTILPITTIVPSASIDVIAELEGSKEQ